MATETFLAKLGINIAAFQKGLDSAKGLAKKFSADVSKQISSNITSAVGGAAAVNQIVSGVKHVVNYADALGELSENLGISTDFLQGFTHGIAESGGSAESAQHALERFSDIVGTAASGSFDAQSKLARFGISIVDNAGNIKTTEQLIKDASDALKSIESPAERAAAAIDLFGKSAPKSLAFLSQGTESLNNFVRATSRLSAQATKDLSDAKDVVIEFGRAITVFLGEKLSSYIRVGRFFRELWNTGSISKSISNMAANEKATADALAPKPSAATDRTFKEVLDKIAKERAEQRKKELDAERKLGEEIRKNLDRLAEFNERRKSANMELESAQSALRSTREDRAKFTLEELATSNIRFSGRLGGEQQSARRAFQLEQWAEQNRRLGFGDLALSQLNTADQIRESLTNLRDSERFPFRELTDRVEQSNVELQRLNHLAMTDGVLIRPTNGE